MQVDGEEKLIFAGSNYLDLGGDPRLAAAATMAMQEYGCAAGGSRLINGNLDLHESFEAELAQFFGKEAALLFNTGYMANVGLIPSLVGPGDIVLSDALNHASIIDGCRLAKAEVHTFPHNDLEQLASLLPRVAGSNKRIVVIVDGIFSMDGDFSPLSELVPLVKSYDAILILDDAHGTGTVGAQGQGSAEALQVLNEVDIVLGTLGKAMGSFGAFVVGTHRLRELLINKARSFIFSCALAPPQVAAAQCALQLIQSEPWRRKKLQANAAYLRKRLNTANISCKPSCTHIVPVIIGDNDSTMAISEELLKRGFFVHGIRPPSVPKGSARLRITPMCSHSEIEIDSLADELITLLSQAT